MQHHLDPGSSGEIPELMISSVLYNTQARGLSNEMPLSNGKPSVSFEVHAFFIFVSRIFQCVFRGNDDENTTRSEAKYNTKIGFKYNTNSLEMSTVNSG